LSVEDNSVHPRLSINQVCFPDADLGEFIELTRSLDARNIVFTSPLLLEPDGLRTAVRALGRRGPRVESIQHRFGVYPNLESDIGMASDTLMRLIAIAAELGARSIYMGTGGRGGLDWEEAARRFATLLAPAVETAREYGVGLLIETAGPLYPDTTIAHTLFDTIVLAERSEIGVCLELFYCWTEGRLMSLIKRASPRCGLVQVSDYILGDRSLPARAVPGDGAVPLARLIRTILSTGYAGVFDIELIGPRIDAEGHLAAASRAARHTEMILTACEAK
jgi:sugar phosphate isomerase/epimerase